MSRWSPCKRRVFIRRLRAILVLWALLPERVISL